MVIGITCALFFALAICHLSLYLQLSGGVILSDYCQNPEEAQKNFIQMPGKSHSESLLNLSFHFTPLILDPLITFCFSMRK